LLPLAARLVERKILLYPNEMVPIQIDRARANGRYLQAPTVNLPTGILAVPARRARRRR
jgi:hypothetical protein